MDTDHENDPAIREVRFLMRMLTNLNAGVMLALCLWLAWAAMEHGVRHAGSAGMIKVRGCGCTLSEVTDWNGRLEVAVRDRFFLKDGEH